MKWLSIVALAVLPLHSAASTEGAIFHSHEGFVEAARKTELCADSLVWNQTSGILTLQDHVIVEQEGLGRLTSEGKVQLCRKEGGNTQDLEWVKSSGETTLSYIDAKGDSHTLTCFGIAMIDRTNLIATLDSPFVEGGIPETAQVHFFDSMGEIRADKVILSYASTDDRISLSKLTLVGNVKIMNNTIGNNLQGHTSVLHYALADLVEYIPATQQMHLSAKSGKRVLVFDCINQLQMSASAMHIKRDAATQKETYEGDGDVHFTFMESELNKLRSSFSLNKEMSRRSKIVNESPE